MGKIISTVVVLDPEGNVWSTPKGKSQWTSVSAAKNAWNCHNWKPKVSTYNPKRFMHEQCKWAVDAEPLGWSVVETKFEVVPL